MPRRLGIAAFVLVALARVASAHQTSVKYVDLAIAGDTVDVRFRVAATDVTEPLGLAPDARPTAAQAAASPAVARYIAHWFALTGCRATPPVATVAGEFVSVTWTEACASTATLRLDFTAFFAVDTRHIAIVRLSAPGAKPVDAIVRANTPVLELRAGQAPPSLLAWIDAGVHHIWEGRDHISFVLALLLVVMLYRDRDGAWQTGSLWPTLRTTATVITAFTVGHSLSLISAALGWVSLPSRVVESLIALSIAYTAGENIVKPDVRWRFGLTFGFGLVHGLGFASVLSKMLPPHDVIVPLLCFNCGVELGQLTILVVALPLFWAICRGIGADRYRNIVMPVLSAVILTLGLNWLIGRALGIVLIPGTGFLGR